MMKNSRASFTLIELLIVIAVVAILSVIVILTLNPAEFLRQAWDSNRLADMNTLNRILSYTRASPSGSTSTVYFSLVDSTATSTAGTDCAGVGLTPPSGWSYHCAASSSLRAVDGTGWLPLDLSSPGFAGALSALPVDPKNLYSSGLYYMYVRGTSSYAVAAALESEKFRRPRSLGDEGYDPERFEMGSDLSLIGRGEGLAGRWALDETSGTAAQDSSGNGIAGTYTGTYTLAAGTLASGNAADFVDQGGHVDLGVAPSLSPTSGGWTLSAWAKPLREFRNDTNYEIFTNETYDASGLLLRLESIDNTGVGEGRIWLRTNQSGSDTQLGTSWMSSVVLNSALHVAATFDGTNARLYLNGALVAGPSGISAPAAATLSSRIGGNGQKFNGLLGDVRFYARPLSDTEISVMYNAQR